MTNGGGLNELEQFQNYLSDYKIIVYHGLSPDRVIFSGNSISNQKLYLLYDVDTGHYNVITNLKAAMAKKYICNVCGTLYNNSHKCEKLAPFVRRHRSVLKNKVLWNMQRVVP